jgi:hypothetical protein
VEKNITKQKKKNEKRIYFINKKRGIKKIKKTKKKNEKREYIYIKYSKNTKMRFLYNF